MDLGVPVTVEIQSGNSTCKLFDKSFGSRTSNKTHRCETLLGAGTGSRWCTYGEELRGSGNEASLCISTTTTLQFCRIGVLLAVGPTLQYLIRADVGDDKKQIQTDSCNGCEH